MGAAEECLKKAFVRRYYIPPREPQVPANCNMVLWTKLPEIFFGQEYQEVRNDPITGIDVLCVAPSSEGAGGVVLLLQITGWVEWELSFVNTRGSMVRETHRIFVSMPLMYKLLGPRMLLMALSPWPIKLIGYASMIRKAFREIAEVEAILAKIVSRQVGFCPDDLKLLEQGLKASEVELNSLLRRAANSVSDVDIASRMQFKPYGTGGFAANRYA